MNRCPSPETIVARLDNAIKSKLVDGHVCHCSRCEIINLNVEIHCKDGEYAIKSRYLPRPAFPCTRETFVDNVYSIYLCRSTGKVHYCHANCDGERITNSDDCVVCCVSGIQYQSEAVRSWKITSRCVATVPVNKQDPYKYSRDSEGRVRLSGVYNLKTTQCVLLAKETIFKLLFSQCRFTIEAKKAKDISDKSKKMVNKYRRHCQKNNLVKNYTHMMLMYIANQQKRANNTHVIRKTKEEMDEITMEYTLKLIAYWKMILQKTELGRTTPSLFSFKTFTSACLYLMKNGVQMHGLYVIGKSKYLEVALPETNTLDSYSISKPGFTQARNKIQEAIRESVEFKFVTPQALNDFVRDTIEKLKHEIL